LSCSGELSPEQLDCVYSRFSAHRLIGSSSLRGPACASARFSVEFLTDSSAAFRKRMELRWWNFDCISFRFIRFIAQEVTMVTTSPMGRWMRSIARAGDRSAPLQK